MEHYPRSDGEWWCLFYRFSNKDRGCVSGIDKLPEVGDKITLLSSSIGVIDESTSLKETAREAFCKDRKKLKVIFVEPDTVHLKATVIVEETESENVKAT